MPGKSAAQLESEIAEALATRPVCAGIDTDDLTDTPLTEAKRRATSEFERCYLQQVMRQAGGSVTKAARIAGQDRTNFRRLLHHYKIR